MDDSVHSYMYIIIYIHLNDDLQHARALEGLHLDALG